MSAERHTAFQPKKRKYTKSERRAKAVNDEKIKTRRVYELSHNILRACHAYKKEDLPTETKEWKFVLNPRYGHRLTEAQCTRLFDRDEFIALTETACRARHVAEFRAKLLAPASSRIQGPCTRITKEEYFVWLERGIRKAATGPEGFSLSNDLPMDILDEVMVQHRDKEPSYNQQCIAVQSIVQQARSSAEKRILGLASGGDVTVEARHGSVSA